MITSCDEGRIYDTPDVITKEEGGNARINAEITGAQTWPEMYTLALAGFEDGNEYALISKNISPATSGKVCDLILTGIPSEVNTIELCALDRLRRRVASFSSTQYVPYQDTLRISLPLTDISLPATIQRDILNTTCVQCHGGSNFAAAGLNLTEGKSFENLIDIPSVKMPGYDRVKPGNSEESMLWLILSGEASSGWKYDHSVEIVRSEPLDLLRNWIDTGAPVNY